MSKTTIKDVLSGRDVRLFVSNVSVNYKDNALKTLIYDKVKIKDDDYVLVTKTIGSKITIDVVKILDDDYLNSFISIRD